MQEKLFTVAFPWPIPVTWDRTHLYCLHCVVWLHHELGLQRAERCSGALKRSSVVKSFRGFTGLSGRLSRAERGTSRTLESPERYEAGSRRKQLNRTTQTAKNSVPAAAAAGMNDFRALC